MKTLGGDDDGDMLRDACIVALALLEDAGNTEDPCCCTGELNMLAILGMEEAKLDVEVGTRWTTSTVTGSVRSDTTSDISKIKVSTQTINIFKM